MSPSLPPSCLSLAAPGTLRVIPLHVQLPQIRDHTVSPSGRLHTFTTHITPQPPSIQHSRPHTYTPSPINCFRNRRGRTWHLWINNIYVLSKQSFNTAVHTHNYLKFQNLLTAQLYYLLNFINCSQYILYIFSIAGFLNAKLVYPVEFEELYYKNLLLGLQFFSLSKFRPTTLQAEWSFKEWTLSFDF